MIVRLDNLTPLTWDTDSGHIGGDRAMTLIRDQESRAPPETRQPPPPRKNIHENALKAGSNDEHCLKINY